MRCQNILLSGKRLQGLMPFEKVTGAAQYGADVHPAGMLYGKIVRSKQAHANILSIDTSEAEKLPGVRGYYYTRRCPKWQTSLRDR